MALRPNDVVSAEDLLRSLRRPASLADDPEVGPLLAAAIEAAVARVDARVRPHLLDADYEVEIAAGSPALPAGAAAPATVAAPADLTAVEARIRAAPAPAAYPGDALAGVAWTVARADGSAAATVYPPSGGWPAGVRNGLLLTLSARAAAEDIPPPLIQACIIWAKAIFEGETGVPRRLVSAADALAAPYALPASYGAKLAPWQAGVRNRV